MNVSEFYLGGEFMKGSSSFEVLNPFNGEILWEVAQAGPADIENAIIAAEKGAKEMKMLPSWKRYEILHKISAGILRNRDAFANAICLEAGKPIQFALQEVDRAATTFSLAADLVRNIEGEVLPLDISPASQNRIGLVRKFPVGIVLAISPFNFPLNLVAHKVAPAIAAGNAVILKPASKTPTAALMLARLIAETDLPENAFSVLPCPGKLAQTLVEDPRINMFSFTGSPEVGWGLKAAAGKKKITLELGGDAAVIVDESANVEDAANKTAMGAFVYAGQVCISVQRIFVHEKVYDEFLSAFKKAMAKLSIGDPRAATTIIGPVIDDANKERILSWIKEAKDGGAKVIAGEDKSEGNVIYPLLLENVPANSSLGQYEAFAPIAILTRVKNMEEAISKVNESRYGLQTGIFTDSQSFLKKAFDELEVGGITVNLAPTFRADNMPYGGVKDSGFGREGLKYAMEEMTEMKLMVW